MAHADNALDALGNSTRRHILKILAQGPKPVGAIAAELPVSRPAVSKHLRILRAAALVEHEPQGTQNVFRLRRDGFADTKAWLGEFDVAVAKAAQVTTAAPTPPPPASHERGALQAPPAGPQPVTQDPHTVTAHPSPGVRFGRGLG